MNALAALLPLLLLPTPTLAAPSAPGPAPDPGEDVVPGGGVDWDRACVEALLTTCRPVRWCVVRAPGLGEGAVFERRGDRWVEVASGDAPGRFADRFRELDRVRVSWSGGRVRVSAPVGALAVLLVPGEGGVLVRRGSTFLRGGALPEGAWVLQSRRVRVVRGRVPVSWGLSGARARESVVSVVWYRGGTRFEWSDWVVHDWGRRSGGKRPGGRGSGWVAPILPLPALRRGRGGRRAPHWADRYGTRNDFRARPRDHQPRWRPRSEGPVDRRWFAPFPFLAGRTDPSLGHISRKIF